MNRVAAGKTNYLKWAAYASLTDVDPDDPSDVGWQLKWSFV
jgi:hypothetical protein